MNMGKTWEKAGWTLAALAWANVVTVAVLYMLYPGYIDHGEPAISAMIWKMLGGAKAYYPLESAERITNIYGPVAYLWHMWPLALFGGSITASKVAACLGAVLMTPALFLLARKAGPVAGWTLAFLTGIYTIVIAFPVVIRPDAILFLLIAFAVFAVARAGDWRWKASLILGLAAGLAVNIKLHAAIYLLPVGLYHLAAGNWRHLPMMAVAAMAAAVAFFLLPTFPLMDYLAWLGPISAKENNWMLGWYWEVALYYFPFLFLALGRRRPLDLAEKIYLGAYGLCILVTLFPATKVGGGSHYFLPFLPLAADLIRRLSADSPNGRQKIAVTVFALFALAGSFQAERRFFKKLEWAKSREVVAEISAVLDRYKDKRVQMTVGRVDTDLGTQLSYHYYSWRNLPVFRGNPYTMDAGIMMELTKLGVPFPDEAIRRIETCHTQVWLVPKDGEPMNLTGYYNQQVFPEAARAAFFAHHTKVSSGAFYDIWECRP
ncbi:hypothetical protein A6A04_00430 [Paramagnetospirillum marisnigri]|uniref:Glycosyltransferase RgtA/B/C/D-like domain-containing protein n=2 Tax=Paramagnetospirillum marisnigri TaxID=1285242 RepID=A0A178MTW7_9PROT|nr:hypothetical protein A6A04_00430 [Paramagnetospirillum marisnigri]